MLYVFHVDTGRMLTFDMNIAVESVDYLKDTINRHHGIPKRDQVLLVSGGETLQSNARVGKYSAGTDTNPIFMFSRTISDATRNPPPPWPSIEADNDLKAHVESCLDLPPTYNTVVTRSNLALNIHEMAREEFKICEKLVMEQHLQQQGWCAVVANLEDITVDFQERCDVFFRGFNEHLEKRDDYREYLSNFNEDLVRLAQIPILPGLVQNAEEKRFSAFDDVYQDQEFNQSNLSGGTTAGEVASKNGESGADYKEPEEKSEKSEKSSSCDRKTTIMSLLQWISATENQRSLRKMAENCEKELEMFDDKTSTTFQTEIKTAVDAASREDMKEIKGLEDRLQGLERLMREARKIVQDQNEMALAFQQNQLRAANLGDTSILPDLCASHRSQLLVMLNNHKNLRDIRRRCSKAKDELGTNLFQRLKFIIQIENIMWDIDSRLLFYHNCLRRLQKHLNIIEQIHQAPSVYVTAVTEVVRRREFSNAFLSWASELACQLLTIYNDEIVRRQEFTVLFEGHFLSTLFPGMNDMPPPFATEAPPVFDSSLPNLTRSDVFELSNKLPEFSTRTSTTFQDMETVIGFFTQSRHTHRTIVTSGEKQSAAPTESQMLKPPDIHSHLKEYEKGFESETDTEEFEKVSQSPIDRRSTVNVQSSSQSNAPVILATPAKLDITTSTISVETQSVETITDETYESTQNEITRLKQLLRRMQEISLDKINLLREQLQLIQQDLASNKETVNEDIGTVVTTFTVMEQEIKNRERELVQRLTVDHELEMNDIRMNVSNKDDELQTLRSEKIDMVAQHESEKCLLRDTSEKLTEEVAELKKRLEQIEEEKQRELNEMKERLTREHKNEIELMRSRIKMMTSVDRSPSDTSLEKIERPDMIDMVNHEIIVAQIKEDLMKEKEAAVMIAVEQERARLESSRTLLAESPRSSNPDFLRRMVEDRDKQLEALRERETMLIKENLKYRDTIQSLADSDITGSNVSILQDKLAQLQQEKEALEHELAREKTRSRSSTTSSSSSRQVNVNMKSCSRNDLVLIVWNPTHGQYTIVQESSTLVFLNEASHERLGLSYPPTGQYPTTLVTMGYITDKEYCHARKNENRYKVAKGQKFYRVKVKPCSSHSSHSIQSSSENVAPLTVSSTSTLTESTQVSAASRSTSTEMIASSYSTQSQRASTALLIDSCAQTDLEPLLEQPSHDMVDSGMGSQQKSMCQSQRTTSEEIMTQLDEASAVADTSEEADGFQYGAATNLRYDIQTSTTSTNSSTNKCFDDEVVDDELESLSDEYRSLENKQEES